MNSFQTVIFDVDSTLCTIEGIDELARMKGLFEEFAPLTKKAMEGKIRLEDAFIKRLEVIRPTRDDLQNLSDIYLQHMTPHADSLLATLHSAKKDIVIVSGGYKEAILPLANKLGVTSDHVFANEIYFASDGTYQGFDKNIPLWQQFGKKKLLASLTLKKKTVLIGDGVSDLEAKEAVDLFIGFGGVKIREIVKEKAEYFITDLQDLTTLIDTI